MKNKKLFKKIAPIVMSVAVAMTSLPVGVFAEDFTSGDGVTAEEYVAEDIYEDTYEEIEEFCNENDIKNTSYNAYNEQITKSAFSKSAGTGGIVISIGGNTLKTAKEYAQNNGDTSFVVVGAKEYDGSATNLTVINFKEEQIAFIAGYIAANMTKSGKIGFVGSVEDASTKAYESGFAAGAYYANRSIQCESRYIGSIDNPLLGGEVAKEMMDGGVDVIYQAAGNSGLGVVDAVKERDKYVIGSAEDQTYLANDNVIASSVKNMDSLLKNIIIEAKKSFPATIEGMRSVGIEDGALYMEYNDKLIASSLKTKVEVISNRIISEEIEVPANDIQLEAFKESVN